MKFNLFLIGIYLIDSLQWIIIKWLKNVYKRCEIVCPNLPQNSYYKSENNIPLNGNYKINNNKLLSIKELNPFLSGR